jgi:hypothetical protein
MKAVFYGKTHLKFKIILVVAIGLLAAVIALGEMGFI